MVAIRHLFLAQLAFVLVVTPIARAGRRINLVTNGSFENRAATKNLPSGWRVNVVKGKPVLTYERADRGGMCVAIEETTRQDEGCFTSAPIAVAPNTRYALCVRYRCRDGALGPPEILCDGNDFYLGQPTKWTFWQHVFITRANTTRVTIKLWMNYRAGQKVWFDDVSLIEASHIPQLEVRASRGVIFGDRAVFHVSPAKGAVRLEFQIARGAKFDSIFRSLPLPLNAAIRTVELPYGRYCARVVSEFANGEQTLSAPAAFLLCRREQWEKADTSPPRIQSVSPPPDARVDAPPAFAVSVVDEGGSGIDVRSAKFQLDGALTNRPASIQKQPGGVIFTFESKTSLTKGRHDAFFTVADAAGNSTMRRWRFCFQSGPRSVARFGEKQCLLFNGLPFFPVGLYCYSHGKRLSEIRDAGFNTILSEATRPSKTYLDSLLHAGLKLMPQVRGPISRAKNAAELEKIFTQKGPVKVCRHPAVLAYWSDEAEGDKFPVARMLSAYRVLKKLDPDHPYFACICRAADYGPYSSTADGLLPDIYPIPHGSPKSIGAQLELARKACGGKPVWFIPQAFDWRNTRARKMVVAPKDFRPTRAELRVMTYLGLIHGAGAILYWASDSGVDTANYPAQWAELKKLAGEMARLAPAILNAKRVRVAFEPTEADIDLIAFESRKKVILLTANASAIPYEVTFRLSTPRATRVKVLFENREGKAEDGSFRDIFKALDTHVYEIDAK